ncbi:uracil-DNA glycosylase family protein [Allohahella marinimesophila]|uniref:Uracil-DNA glycosylase family protein n=1 Tax=Allohahella marinimesophila TaxID=1054972 RepID=A0ABP7NML8_9GAMM
MAGLIPEAKPIFQLPVTARIGIFSQAPGNKAHLKGLPFFDPSGVRLRSWLGVDETAFYESGKFAIAPMAFCFPGYDGSGKTGKGGDKPPVSECAERWRTQLMAQLMPQLDLVLLIGQYAQRWHLPEQSHLSMTARVANWRAALGRPAPGEPILLPMPHPSWRNTAWLKKNPWFEDEFVPELQARVRRALQGSTQDLHQLDTTI